MNTLNRKLLILNLAILLLAGGFSFTSLNPLGEQDQRVDEQAAIAMHDNYNRTAKSINGTIEAVYLDRQTIGDINAVLTMNQSSDGVRIYFGKDEKDNTVNLIVNTNGRKHEDDMNFILKSTGEMGVCPEACDLSSPFMGGE